MKVLGIAGYSGSGKTTLIEKIVPILVKEGLRVSLIKHAHHEFDVDQRGKDSFRHRQAGCTEVLVSSSTRWALMHELRGEAEPDLEAQLRHFSPCDLVLVEGYKADPIPRIEVHRSGGERPLLFPQRPARDRGRDRRAAGHETAAVRASTMPRPSPGFILEFVAGREGRPRLAAVPD